MTREIPSTKREIREIYDEAARWYDCAEGIVEVLGVRRLRRELFGRAEGRVLEVACGTGKNFRAYRGAARDAFATDMSWGMLEVARGRADDLGIRVRFAVMDGEALAFRDGAFDTVLSSLTVCTFLDPVRALREMARVCRPDGRILLLEHGRSERSLLARLQDRGAAWHARSVGCWWNREPLELARQAGLGVERARRTFFGVFNLMELRPA